MKKILIIRFSSIGDIVLTTPVIRCIKAARPNVEIHYLTKAQNLPLLEVNPYINKIWLFRDSFKEMIPLLQSENFDFIVDLHKNLRSKYVITLLKRPSADFPKLDIKKWLIVQTKINLLPEIHIVDRYFKAVEPIGVFNDGNGIDFFIPAENEVNISTLPVAFHSGYIAFVIGGKHNTKLFPVEKVAQVSSILKLPVILLGGSEDFERGERIKFLTKNIVLNACGMYNINQSASLVKQSDTVITNDTGLMHIAAAFKKPVVSIWGNTIPGFGMYPYQPENEAFPSLQSEVSGLSCRPCSKLGYDKCPRGHFRCMLDQDTNRIANFVNKIVS